MASLLAHEWGSIDRFIQSWRYNMVLPNIAHDSVVVDLGCGDGHFLTFISRIIKQGMGFDPFLDKEMIAPGDCPNIALFPCDPSKGIPLETGSVDVITGLAVLEHMEHPQEAIAECHRILKPLGRLVLTTPSPAAKPILEAMAKLNLISRADIADHKHYYNPNELFSLLTAFYIERISFFQCGLNQLVIATTDITDPEHY